MRTLALDTDPKQMRLNILALAWPAILRLFLQSIVGMVDVMMVGRIGTSAIASVDMSNRLVFVMLGALMSLTIGSTTLVAHHVGAGEKEKANNIMWQSLMGAMIVSLILAITGFLFSRELLHFMMVLMEDSDLYILNQGSIYLRIVFISMVFSLPTMVINSVFQGLGDMKTPLIIMVITNIVNVLMNYLLIFGIWIFPEMGIIGAALGTALGRVVGLIVGLTILTKGKSGIKIVWKSLSLKIDMFVIKSLLRIGIPASIEQLVRQSSQILYTMLVAGLGTVTLAANAITMNISSLAFMPGFGFGLAATTLVGQSLGAGKPELASKYGRQTTILTVVLMGSASILMYLFSGPIIGLYSDDPEVILLASQTLRIFVMYQPFFGIFMVLAGGLRGAGDTKWVMYATIMGNWIFRMSFTLLFIFIMDLGLRGIWFAMGIDVIIRSALIIRRFRSGKWKTLKVLTKSNKAVAENKV